MSEIKETIKKSILHTPVIKSYLLKRIRRAGYDIRQGINPPVALFNEFGINLLFDIGANTGQFAQRVRSAGYKDRIISFEPVSDVSEKLKQNARKDPLWTALDYGCGDYDGEATINVSEVSLFSSILDQLPSLGESYTKPNYVRKEQIKVCKIDSVFDRYYKEGDKVLLKLDTQGFEKKVLEGAAESLKKITAIQLELSFIPLYAGEVLIKEMVDFMDSKGFTLVSLEPLQSSLRKRKFVQADGIFFRLP